MEHPLKEKTPGEFNNSVKIQFACLPHYTEGKDFKGENIRNVSQKIRNEVYESYGIPKASRKQYTIDHYIPLGLLGTNSKNNLWPQPRTEAKIKDSLENKLRKLVCSGKISLNGAQKELLENNWEEIYEKHKN